MGCDDDTGGLAFEQVATGRFAGDLRRAEYAEDIVAQLERLSQRIPISTEGVDQLIAAGHRRADLQRSPHRVVAGLAACDIEHGVQIR